MGTYRFQIGSRLPAEDEVARFVTVLAMISNDWHRSTAGMNASLEREDGPGVRLMLFRQQAASYREAVKFIADACRHFPRIAQFVRELDAPTYAEAMAGHDPSSALHGWLEDHRDVTFHYPELHPSGYVHGQEELGEALKTAAELAGTITEGDTMATTRFGFADEVAVQLLPDFAERAEELADAWLALDEFIHTAVADYLQPPG